MPVDPDVHLQIVTGQPYLLRLYRSGTGGNLVEVEGGGYEPQPLGPFFWTVHGASAKAEREFRFSGAAGRVEGYYLTRENGQVFVWEPLAEPVDVGEMGGVLTVRPTLEAERLQTA